MTLRDVCDVVYAAWLEDLSRQAASERQVAAVLIAAGAQDQEMPDLATMRATLDAALVEEPRQVDAETRELMRALRIG